MTPKEEMKGERFLSCRFREPLDKDYPNDGISYCTKLKHTIANGPAIICHCLNCPHYQKRLLTAIKDMLKPKEAKP